MRRKYCLGGRRASAASIMACLALLCMPAVSIAADFRDSPAEAADRASSMLVPGAGYGQPQGEPRVRALQRSLRALGQRPGPVDGLYGPLTEAAVERVQRDSGLSVDGIVGPQTRRVLKTRTPPLAPGAGYGQPGGSPQVRAIQRRLRALGHRPGPVDGLYGPRTQAAIERFRRTAGQPATGVLSPATVVAVARADGDQPARAASDTRRSNVPSKPAAGSDQSRTEAGKTADDRTEGTEGGHPTSPVLFAVLLVSLAAIGSLLAGWLTRRRTSPEASGLTGGPVGLRPIPGVGRKAPKPSAGSTAPSGPERVWRRHGAAALGYVSVHEAEAVDGLELGRQMAAIDAACRQRGLVLKAVIRDVEEVNDTGPERPGMRSARQRLEAGEASCLVVAELGRLGRSAREICSIVEWLRRREARLVSVDRGLDTGTPTGGKAADVLVSLGAFDDQPRPSARGGHPETRPSERTSGSSRPAKADVAALTERIWTMHATGMTLQAIADRLNEEGVPTLRGGAKWRPSELQPTIGYPPSGLDASEPRNGNGGERGRSGSAGRDRLRHRSGGAA
jgi:peptidoglycan hydrolase-like protein with peptidoglycan-binding domain